MHERPILFSGPMVRAILDGRKTQTRRVISPQPAPHLNGREPWEVTPGLWAFSMPRVEPGGARACHSEDTVRSPFRAGMRLWVRETWQQLRGRAPASRPAISSRSNMACDVVWRSDGELHWRDIEHRLRLPTDPHGDDPIPWRPSIFMPRWASRLTLEVTGVRVERLQAISEADAQAEGFIEWQGKNGAKHYGLTVADVWERTARQTYARLWDSLNGERAPWSSNPWVFVVAFRRIKLAGCCGKWIADAGDDSICACDALEWE